jgi:hypothetical protein
VVFEQMLTVFFAAGVGVAIVLYASRSRRSVAPSSVTGQDAAVQAYVATETVQASVAEAPVVEASSVSQPQVVNEIPSATSEVATPTEEAAAVVVAAPAVVEAVAPIVVVEPTVMESQASSAVSTTTTAADAPAQTTEKPRRARSSTRRRSSGTASSRTRSRASEKTTEQS